MIAKRKAIADVLDAINQPIVAPITETKEKSELTGGASDQFVLTVRDTNNLVRHLYTGGWISHEQHPEVHKLLDEMIAFLEKRGVRVDMNMERM